MDLVCDALASARGSSGALHVRCVTSILASVAALAQNSASGLSCVCLVLLVFACLCIFALFSFQFSTSLQLFYVL